MQISFLEIAIVVFINNKIIMIFNVANNIHDIYLNISKFVSWNIKIVAIVIAAIGKEYAHQER